MTGIIARCGLAKYNLRIGGAIDYRNFEDLTKEHAAFEALLDCAKTGSITRISLEKLAFLLDHVHHGKEENILFPLLFENEGEDQSGPKCTNFFTPRVMNACAWQDPYHALYEKLGGVKPPANQSAFREKVFSSGRMIRIPLEDHLLGEEAMRRMQSSDEDRLSIFPHFSRMLRDHIKREEECLLPLLRSVLSEEQKTIYAEAAAALDKKLGAASCLLDLCS